MPADVARNEELFEAIQQFQQKRCGRPFCAKYGAFGTGIGWRIRQSDAGSREPVLCLRVFVKAKGRHSAAMKLPRSFRYTIGGKTVRIPVDVCNAIPQSRLLHSSFIPSQEGTFSGFEARVASQPRGTLGGWAWHPASDSLVMLSCWHVLGDKPADASDHIYYNGIVARVRGGVRVIGGKRTNQVDCAFADPLAEVVDAQKFLERVPPVFAAGAPVGATPRRTPVSRYRRWTKAGTMDGVVDAVSVEMYINYGARRCWFTDLFIVHREDGPWGEPGDSGSLVFDRDDQRETRTALGVYMGAIVEGVDGKTRTLGVACRMDRVVTALNLEFVGLQPILAFLDSLFERDQPLDFLAQRRGSIEPVVSQGARGRAAALFEHMKQSGGRALVGPLTRQQRAVVGLLVEQERIRVAAARALCPILSGQSPEKVGDHMLTDAERTALIELLVLLRGETRLRMRGALKPYLEAVRDRSRKTFGDVLRAADQLAPPEYSLWCEVSPGVGSSGIR